MAGWINFFLIANAMVIVITESQLVPIQPISVMVDAYGKPIMFLRDRRAAIHPYPQRTMMFAGYYKPIRRSNNGGQATGVFAQGNAVSGEAYFGGLNTPYYRNGPPPIEESEVPSAEVHTTPEGTYNKNDQEQEQTEEEYLKKQFQDGVQQQEDGEYLPQDSSIFQQQPEQIPLTTEIVQSAEESTIITSTKAPVPRPKIYNTKKTQKKPVDTDDDYGEDETDEDDDEPIIPFIPFKGNKRRQGYPNLSNFFPMIFNYPKIAARAGASGSPPGTVTAVANSYSRSKGGVASAVANAFGGPPIGKKRRSQQTEE